MVVAVADNEAYRGSCRFAFEDSAEELYLVFLVAACRYGALSRTAAVEFLLDEGHVDVYPCGHAVDDAADSGAVALAEGGQGEYRSCAV